MVPADRTAQANGALASPLAEPIFGGMSDTETALVPSRQQIAAKTASKPGRVTGKLRDAIDRMVEDGDAWNDAAVKAGLTVRSMRLALKRPHTLAYLKQARQVFLTLASAKNPLRLVQIRDQDENRTAAVNAIRAMERLEDDQPSVGHRVVTPGVMVIINNATPRVVDDEIIEIQPA